VPAPDAEALMRSRYSAYALGLADYLLATWHPDTRPADLTFDEQPPVRWLGLDVKRHEPDGDRAVVEFVARFRQGGGRASRLHETSRFVRETGRWYYVDGEIRG
jgi:SEC-C motif-containing protein